jgi:hypothetical protein
MDKGLKIKERLFEEQKGKCFYCGINFPIEQLDIEHLMPRSLTSDDSVSNKVLSCRVCNLKRADSLPFQEQELSTFIVELLNNHPDFRNVNQDLLISKSQHYRGDIVVERNIKGEWHKTIIEVKSFPTFTDKRLNDIISQLSAYKKHFENDIKLVLAFPGTLPIADNSLLKKEKIEVWSRSFIAKTFKEQIENSNHLLFQKLFYHQAIVGGVSYSRILIRDLKNIKKGREDWSRYQRHVRKILDYLFGKTLSSPINESSDKFGINRRDYILRNYCENGFWKYLREKYQADFIVIDAKNYVGKIKKNQILQIANYLKQHGTGLFAIIITRNNEEDTGSYFTRREKWITENKMIIILDDNDLEKMILANSNSNSAEEIIKQRIEDFRLEI